MKKVYHLATCNTCQRIIKELGIGEEFEYQEIKSTPITPQQLDDLKELAGSYEALFNRRSRKYTAMKLKERTISEDEYRELILGEYTFLKRPVFLVDGNIFIGNAKKVTDALAELLMEK